MRIEFDRHPGRHRNGLMHGAAMRDLEKPLTLFCRNTMWQVNRQGDLAYPMRLFRHGPFRLDTQAFGRDLMTVAIATDEIPDATGDGADEELDRTHAGILPPVLGRLIGHDPVSPAGNVVTSPAMV